MEKRFGSSRTRRDVNELIEAETSHAGAAQAVHGLPAGVALVGCKQGTRRIEVKAGTVSHSFSGAGVVYKQLTVTFDNAFGSAPLIVWGWSTSTDGAAAYVQAFRERSVSATSVTQGFALEGLGAGNVTARGELIAVGT